ncbi:MAG TPA: hypothetical protein VJ652_20640 [Noviherbaspirillum sp.]|nr:hypothetical protein [Noviherbaspirillum sp.]
MPILNRSSEKHNKGQRAEPTSSHGIQSPAVTPPDLVPEDAASRDVTEHKLHSDDLEERAQALLDEAIEETFPASDPISIPTFEEALETVKAQKAREEAAAAARR